MQFSEKIILLYQSIFKMFGSVQSASFQVNQISGLSHDLRNYISSRVVSLLIELIDVDVRTSTGPSRTV